MYIQVAGDEEVVKRFMKVLELQRDLTLDKVRVLDDREQFTMSADLMHTPARDIQVLQLNLGNGTVVKISLSCLVRAEIEEGVQIFSGKSYDIFSGK